MSRQLKELPSQIAYTASLGLDTESLMKDFSKRIRYRQKTINRKLELGVVPFRGVTFPLSELTSTITVNSQSEHDVNLTYLAQQCSNATIVQSPQV